METIVLAIFFALSVIYHFVYVILHKPKTLGRIIITDEEYMYVELNDEKSMDEIRTSKHVTFEVSHK